MSTAVANGHVANGLPNGNGHMNGQSNGNGNGFLNNLITNSLMSQVPSHMKNHAPTVGGENNSNKNKKDEMSIVSLREIIENYAYKFFKENEKEYHRKIGKSYGWKELIKEIDWKNFKIRHEPVHYQEVEAPGRPKSHVLFRTTFINDTEKEQDYQLRAERRTVSSCNIEIFEGFVSESQANLSLEVPLPGCVLEGGTGFRSEYVLENTTSKSIEEEMNWSVESNIKIPGMSKTTAELLVQEDQYKGQFEIKTYFSGELRIKLFRDSQEMLIIELGDLDEIFGRERGFKRDRGGLYKLTRGECKARFGVEQKVELHQQKLKEP